VVALGLKGLDAVLAARRHLAPWLEYDLGRGERGGEAQDRRREKGTIEGGRRSKRRRRRRRSPLEEERSKRTHARQEMKANEEG
jgi:hypothetical protein